MHHDAEMRGRRTPVVAFFASAYYPTVGGVQEVVRQLARRQAQAGARSLIITNRWPKDLPARSDYEGVPVRRYVFRVPERNPKQLIGAAIFTLPTLASLCRDLRRAAADLINVHCVSSNAHYALLARRATGLPLVLSLHGELTVDSGGLFQRSQFAQNLLRTALDEADAVTACSAKALAEAEAFYGKSLADRASVVYSGVDTSEFANVAPFAHPRPYLLAVGRLERPKGFDVLLDAFKSLVDSGATCDLIVGGVGAELDALRSQAQNLGLGERVVFPGRLDRGQVRALFAGCLFFVLPSRIEPMGIVNLEAMSSGKAVAATGVGGVPELVIDGETGLLAPPEDARALAGAIRRLLEDDGLRNKLGSAGKRRAAAFDWSRSAAQYRQIFERAADPLAERSFAEAQEI